MLPGDIFHITFAFLFDAQAYGDEKAHGGVNIYNAYGNEGYFEINPVKLYLEECPDK